MTGQVSFQKADGVGVIEFYHPQSNSLPSKLLTELEVAIVAAGSDPEVLVIVLKSSGEKAFCAGASFDELKNIQNEREGHRFFTGFAHVINAMRRAPKFIIVRVQGKCVGGGLGLVSAGDYCIATDAAEVKLSELGVGLGPFVVGPPVERKIGLAAFSQLAINATSWQNAEWAKQKGLYTEVYPSIMEMDKGIDALTAFLVKSNPVAMSDMKKIFWTGTDHWDQLLSYRATISGRLVISEFTKKAISK